MPTADRDEPETKPPHEPKDVFGRRLEDLPFWGECLSVCAGVGVVLACGSWIVGAVVFFGLRMLLPGRPSR